MRMNIIIKNKKRKKINRNRSDVGEGGRVIVLYRIIFCTFYIIDFYVGFKMIKDSLTHSMVRLTLCVYPFI